MNIDLYVMAAIYGFAGITHFTHTRFFELAVPKVLVYRRFIALFSGVLEIMIAMGLLYAPTRSITAIFLMVFLVAIFPANICLLYTSPSPRDRQKSRMPSSA